MSGDADDASDTDRWLAMPIKVPLCLWQFMIELRCEIADVTATCSMTSTAVTRGEEKEYEEADSRVHDHELSWNH